jgi:hypothetical protein
MDGLYPEVGMAGSYKASSPFDTLITSQVRYDCLAVESLQGLVARGEDPYADIYAPRGITLEQYGRELGDNVRIITLQSFKGELLRIPHPYLLNLPDASGVRYTMVMLGVNLSATPDGLDLSILKRDIAELVLDRIGVQSDIREVVYGPVTLLTHQQHKAVQSTRKQRTALASSNLQRARILEKHNTLLKQRLEILERYIEDHHVPAGSPG